MLRCTSKNYFSIFLKNTKRAASRPPGRTVFFSNWNAIFFQTFWLPNSAIRSNHRIKSENETITGNNFRACQPSKYHVLRPVWRPGMMRIFSIFYFLHCNLYLVAAPKKGAKKCNNGRYSKTITRDNYQSPAKSCFHIREGIINLI